MIHEIHFPTGKELGRRLVNSLKEIMCASKTESLKKFPS